MKEDLIKRLVALGFKNARIEHDLKLPKNSLSAVLKGHKTMPTKWINPVERYLIQHENTEDHKFDAPPLPENFPGDELEFAHPKPWIKLIEVFCEDAGITPEDMIKWYKTPEISPKPPLKEEKQYPTNWAEMGRLDKLKWLTANNK